MIAYLPEDTHYTVVVSGGGRTTAAITDVPVSTAMGATRLNTAATPIVPPVSATARVSGLVTNASNTALTDASVSAQQSLSSLQMLDVAWGHVDPGTAQYSLILPLAAPLKAAYAGDGGPLSFSTDTVAPGLYKVDGSATGYATQTTDPTLTLGAPDSTSTKDLVLAP